MLPMYGHLRYKLKNKKKQDGAMLSKGAWVVKAQWYESTSGDQQRRSYELHEDVVLVPVDVLVQEVGLQFQRAGLHQRVLTDASHATHLVEICHTTRTQHACTPHTHGTHMRRDTQAARHCHIPAAALARRAILRVLKPRITVLSAGG